MHIKHKSYTVAEAQKKLEHYCAYQERCHKEVRQKLKALNIIPEAIDIIVVHLLKHNFLNEERFAKTYTSGKFRIKKWGRYRITLELKKRDISKTNILAALGEIDEEEYLEVFNALAENKFGRLLETNTMRKKKKLTTYLIYRGWESHLVYAKVNELVK